MNEEKRAEEITVKELEEQFRKCLLLDKEHDDLKAKAALVWHELESLQVKLGIELEKLGMQELRLPLGNFSYKDQQSYLVPKEQSKKELFFNYLKERGLFEGMITVNSQTLNSFLKHEEDLAEENNIFDFQVPGIERGAVTRKFKMKQLQEL